MKRYYLALFVCGLVPRLAVAQGEPALIAIEKVSYSRAVPKALLAYTPHGGKSRFWGASKLDYQGKKVWIHVYDVRKTQFAKDDTNVNGKQDSGLDLFVFAKAHRLKRVSSTRFTYGRYGGYERGGDFETVGVQTLWLDPKSHKMPIAQVAFQNPNGLYGTITKYTICVFNQGSGKEAVVEKRFGYGSSNGADWNSWTTDFGVDETGLITIVYREGSMHAGRTTIYKWQGSSFMPFERRQRKNYPDDAPEEIVPLTEP